MTGHGRAVTGLILGYLFAVPWLAVGVLYVLGRVWPTP